MKQIVRIAFLWTPAVVMSTVLMFRFVHAQVQRRLPYTLEKQLTTQRADGQTTLTRLIIVAARSDGSRVELRRSDNGKQSNIRVIHDVTGKRVVVDPLTESVITYPLSAQQVQALKEPTNCPADANAARETILGFGVHRIQATDDFKEQIVKSERWVASELDCYPLRRVDVIERDGKPYGRQTEEVTSVKTGDPDPALFSVPANYTERSPSEVLKEVDRRQLRGAAAPCTGCNQKANSVLDNIYFAARDITK